MVVQRSVVEIGLLLYPGVQTAALHGLTDLFAVAERIAAEEAAGQLPALRVSHWSGEAGSEPHRVFDTHPGADSRLVAVLVPPSLFGLPDAAPLRNLTDWLAARHGAVWRLLDLYFYLHPHTGELGDPEFRNPAA